jgi:hypothetical protein
MKRTSVVTGRPIYSHPEKDGFANEVFLSATGADSPALAAAKASLNKMIDQYNSNKAAADAEAANLAKGTYSASSDRYTDPIHGKSTVAQWQGLNNANALQYSNLTQLQKDIDKQRILIDSLLPVEERVALTQAQSNAETQQTAAASKASNTKIFVIGGIVVAVISAIGLLLYLKHKK